MQFQWVLDLEQHLYVRAPYYVSSIVSQSQKLKYSLNGVLSINFVEIHY